MKKASQKIIVGLLLISPLLATGEIFLTQKAYAAGEERKAECVNLLKPNEKTLTTHDECVGKARREGWSRDMIWDGRITRDVAEKTKINLLNAGKSWWDFVDCAFDPLDCALRNFAATMSEIALRIVSLFTMIGGLVLNGAIFHTVVNVSQNYENLPAIDEAWRVIRDVANMSFIFVLLYAAINTMIGRAKDTQQLIVKIIVIAVLINFSLFFTKFVIDISNVLSLTFYDAMVPNALQEGFTGRGLSDAFMKELEIQKLYSNGGANISFAGIIMTGVMGSIMLLIAAFVFFTVGILFVIRYVVLIMVLILSPIAFIAFILPEAQKYQKQWADALIGQAFFAPIYLMLTWVTLKILGGINDSGAFSIKTNVSRGQISGSANPAATVMENSDNALGLFPVFIDYIVVIAFLIFSLVVAKDFAGRVPGGFGKVMSAVTGFAGGATFGLAGWAGRKTLGNMGSRMADDAKLQRSAREDDGLRGAWSRLKLYGAQQARSGTFDMRNATIPTRVIGDAIEGTLGRTPGGKMFGLDEVRVPNIPLGSVLTSNLDSGTPATLGYKEEEAAKAKRMAEQKRAATEELSALENEQKILDGVDAAPGSVAHQEMEKALAKMSDKEVEAIVDSNRQLLEELSFANALSVKQLEALNKSDKFSEDEKNTLKKNRFATINAAMEVGGDGAVSVKDEIQALTKEELEMIDPEHLKDMDFVAQLKQGQFDKVVESTKFTNSQRKTLKELRAQPLKDKFASAYAGGGTTTWSDVREEMLKLGESGLAKLDAKYDPAVPTTLNTPQLDHPDVVELYSPSILNKMAAQSELSTAKRVNIRKAILDKVYGNTTLAGVLHDLTNPPPSKLRLSATERAAKLASLATDEERKLVTSAEWLESENGQQIF